MWRLVFALMLFATSTLPSFASFAAESLKGLQAVAVLVEQLDQDSTSCGLDKTLLENSIAYPLTNSRLKVGQSEHAAFYVQVSTLYFKNTGVCASAIDTKVFVDQPVTITTTHNTAFVEVILWSNGVMISSERSNHRRRVASELEQLTKRFVVDWAAQN